MSHLVKQHAKQLETQPRQQVSKEDFVEHHANLSFGVPSDAQFRQLITNCWGLDDPNAADHNRMSQADGIMVIGAIASSLAGSSNLRKFLVSYADGSQSVEELSFSSEVREVEGVIDCCMGRLFTRRTFICAMDDTVRDCTSAPGTLLHCTVL